jgi:hypothetical protein
MLPPVNSKTKERDTDAPIRFWEQLSAFDTAKECEHDKAAAHDGAKASGDTEGANRWASALCLPSEHIYPPAKAH